jgi:hypothetical protein
MDTYKKSHSTQNGSIFYSHMKPFFKILIGSIEKKGSLRSVDWFFRLALAEFTVK